MRNERVDETRPSVGKIAAAKSTQKSVQEVTVSALVPPGTPVVLIEAPILRRLQAENKVLRNIADELDLSVYKAYSVEPDEGWEKYFNFEDRIQAILRDRPALKDRE